MQLPRNLSAIALLRVLLAASIAGPVLLFTVVAWLNYRSAFADAWLDLERTCQVAEQQAVKVFDGQIQVADRVNDLVRGMDQAAIIANEKQVHEGLARIVMHLPEVQSVLIAGADGRPLASAGIYPLPTNANVSNTDYLRAVLAGYSGTFVSRLQVGSVIRRLFFGLARPWTRADGRVAGVIDIAVLPSYFQDFYEALVGEGGRGGNGKVVTLIRSDGQFLSRFPPLPSPAPAASSPSAFFAAVAANPDRGTYESRSMLDPDRPERLFAYRKVASYPLYVVAGQSRAAVIAGWRRAEATHLIFGVPATLALFAITWTALVRTRREAQALARVKLEMQLRQQAEEALLRAQRLEAVGQLTGGIAHDFNNLLTIIVGNSELLDRLADQPSRVRQLARRILLAARRGADVTQKLLTFSRRQLINPLTIDINQRLREFKALINQAASERIPVVLDLDPRPMSVKLDPGQFEAAILNLVGNARDAMPNGGRIIVSSRSGTVSAADDAGLPPGEYVVVAVADTGTGMNPETAAKAFEPFFTTKEIGKGTGLGLSQVYGFAKQANGDARIVSSAGTGTTVELILPRSRDEPRPERTDAAAAPRPTAGEVILVVEDEPAVLEMVVESLRETGYAAFGTPDAETALDHLRRGERIDVLFSDVVMPGRMNGLQLAAAARRLRPGLKVLMTSGYTGAFALDAERDFDLLIKPYDREQLARRIHEVMSGVKAADSSAEQTFGA